MGPAWRNAGLSVVNRTGTWKTSAVLLSTRIPTHPFPGHLGVPGCWVHKNRLAISSMVWGRSLGHSLLKVIPFPLSISTYTTDFWLIVFYLQSWAMMITTNPYITHHHSSEGTWVPASIHRASTRTIAANYSIAITMYGTLSCPPQSGANAFCWEINRSYYFGTREARFVKFRHYVF